MGRRERGFAFSIYVKKNLSEVFDTLEEWTVTGRIKSVSDFVNDAVREKFKREGGAHEAS